MKILLYNILYIFTYTLYKLISTRLSSQQLCGIAIFTVFCSFGIAAFVILLQYPIYREWKHESMLLRMCKTIQVDILCRYSKSLMVTCQGISNVYMHIHTCIHACMYAYNTYIHTHTHTYTHTHIHTYMHACMHTIHT